jgi:tRNA (guanine-N7-)-methyltransferase
MYPSWIEITAENLCEPLNIEALFQEKQNPLEIDLGAGDGSFTLESASRLPKVNFLAVERLKGRALKIARKATHAALPNLRVLRMDGLYTLEHLIPAHSVAGLHLLFPDPWPKRRHQKYRILQEPFLKSLKRVLTAGGFFHFATDDAPYWMQGLNLMTSDADFISVDPLREIPLTDFERHWLGLEREIRHSWWILRNRDF